MRKLLLALGLCACLIWMACDRGGDVISEGKMADVTADLKLAEAFANSQMGWSSDSARASLRDAVFKKHGITLEQYDRSLEWYGHNLEKYVKLCDAVDERLNKRESRILAGSAEARDRENANSIWPYSPMLMLSPKGNTDAITFAISGIDLAKGDRLAWKLHLSDNPGVTLTLGVDYAEGGTSYFIRRFTGQNGISAELQTDSSKVVKRVFGFMAVDSRRMLPLWVDSISLTTMPLAPENYSKILNQHNYTEPKRRLPGDTVSHRPPTVKPISDDPEGLRLPPM